MRARWTTPGMAVVAAVLVIAGALPIVGAQSADEWRLPDGTGDQFYVARSGQTVPVGANPATSHTDLRGVTIRNEDETSLEFAFLVSYLKVRPAKDPANAIRYDCGGSGLSQGGGFSGPVSSRATYELAFGLADTDIKFRVDVRVLGDYDGPGATGAFVARSAIAYLCVEWGGPQGGGRIQPAVVQFDEANFAIRIVVRKDAMMARLPDPRGRGSLEVRPTPVPVPLDQGSRLVDFVAGSNIPQLDTYICCTDHETVRDVAPNQGPSPEFVLQRSTANRVIALELAGGATALGVAPGVNISIPARLVNGASGKRLVFLSFAAVTDSGDAPGYSVSGPAALTVPAGEANPPVRLVARGVSTGYESEIAGVTVPLQPSPVLGPNANVVFVHAAPNPGPFDGLPAPAYAAGCNGWTPCATPFLSAWESDPAAVVPDEFPQLLFFGSTGIGGSFEALQSGPPFPLPLAFAPGQPARVDLKLKADAPIDNIAVKVTLAAQVPGEPLRPGRNLGTGQAAGSASSGGSLVTVTVTPPDPNGLFLPAGSRLTAVVDFRIPHGPGSAGIARGLMVVGRESKITLPLVEVPEDLLLGATGPFQLTAPDGREDFVNPGEARLFNLTLINQSPERHDVHVDLAASPSSWRASVVPGADFRLDSGDAIRLAVRVFAPAQAAEGERGSVWVNATQEGSTAAGLRLTAIATRGVELEDDVQPYEPDADTKAKLVSEAPAKQPGPGALGVLAAVAVVILFGRRFREGTNK
ncbi:MAG: hypothetical protein HYT80_06570 [Euryarchaeota archaeon]|nr:hypothetical protein [Euryarchaeota archaeon]